MLCGDARELLREFPDSFFDCCITSPPYWNLREYSSQKEIGREPTPQLFIKSLMQVFDLVHKKLKPSGSLWVNIGDTYREGSPLMVPEEFCRTMVMGHGWKLINKIVWAKPDAMSESAKKRFKQTWEPMYWFTKSNNYYFNEQAAKIPVKSSTVERMKHQFNQGKGTAVSRMRGMIGDMSDKVDMYLQEGVNAGDCWFIPTNKRKVQHAAPYPIELCVRPLVSTCPPNGKVLDPFAGSATTGLAALEMGEGRQFYGMDLNPESAKESNDWLSEELKQPTLF